MILHIEPNIGVILPSRRVRCEGCGQMLTTFIDRQTWLGAFSDDTFERLPQHKISKAKATKKRPSRKTKGKRLR